MSGSHFPCRVCGQPTIGIDTYVVCEGCSSDFEMRSRERIGDGIQHLPPITGEIEERLKKLLDDW